MATRKSQSWFRSLVELMQRALRWLVGGWSLERKSLLFLGVALVVPIGLSFWFVLQVLADRLVMQTTRQAARDYSRAVIAWRHVTQIAPESVFPGQGSQTVFADDGTLYKVLRTHLVDNPEYSKPEFLMLDEVSEHSNLQNASRPSNEQEAGLLAELEKSYREQLQKLSEAQREIREKTTQELSGQIAPLALDEEVNRRWDQSEPVRNLRNSLQLLYRAYGPYVPDENELTYLRDRQLVEQVPRGGWYVYYHAISFPDRCMLCHQRETSQAEELPFRAVRILIPYAQTQVASTKTLAIMIAVAMVTVAATLLVVHWVFRRLVLNPLKHLQSVSEEISRGNTDLRANIDTGDEFNELGDAFNKMLRHMTENQEQLEELNQELDLRVDQLAQANFNLYEANRLKSDFLANMSHELRTPLNSIIGFSDVLRDIAALSGKQRKYAENIQSSGKLLLEMINEILDLAKIEAGKMQVSASSFEVSELISGQCDALRPLVDEKNVDFKVEFLDGPIEVFQDRAKIQQILTNLLSNAIKFTPDGGMITVRSQLIDDRSFQLEVEDTGVGIPESDFEIIFEKFRQSDAVLQNDGLTRQYAGTGLGLSIVKELCKLLGGEIQLTSQLGTGSSFRVLLPLHFQAGEIQDVASLHQV
ncbi:MAG: ATP-binding protein [bacterium]|nr:ATP-binding protein [bacterium]